MVSAFVHDPTFMHERRAKGGRVDYAGIALLALSLGLLQIVLDRGQRADWFNTPWVVYAASFSALSFVLLVLRELLFSEPILDLQVFKQTAFLVATRLVEHFSVFEAWRLPTIAAHLPGSPGFQYLPWLPSTHQQLGVIYGLIQAQSAMLAFNDIYWIIAIAIIPLIPLCSLLPSSKPGGTADHR